MDRTTIELSEENKAKLQEMRLEHENNYNDTIGRLVDNSNVEFVTASEARDIADAQIMERVIPEAQE